MSPTQYTAYNREERLLVIVCGPHILAVCLILTTMLELNALFSFSLWFLWLLWKEHKVYKRGQNRATLFQERFWSQELMEKMILFGWGISNRGVSTLPTKPRKSHVYHLQECSHTGGHSYIGNQPEKNNESLPTADQWPVAQEDPSPTKVLSLQTG